MLRVDGGEVDIAFLGCTGVMQAVDEIQSVGSHQEMLKQVLQVGWSQVTDRQAGDREEGCELVGRDLFQVV
jgi:hypothetical protein